MSTVKERQNDTTIDERRNRIAEAIKLLKKSKIVDGYKDIADALGYKRINTISDLVKGRLAINDRFVNAFCTHFGVNPNWVKTGKGQPFNTPPKKQQPEAVVVSSEEIVSRLGVFTQTNCLIPFFLDNEDLKKIEDTASQPFIDNLHKLQYMAVPELRAQFSINVFADNMSPEYKPGHKIAVQYVDKEMIFYGFKYLVLFKDGQRYLCELRKGKTKDTVLLCNANSYYQDKEVKFDQIERVFLVKGYSVLQTQ